MQQNNEKEEKQLNRSGFMPINYLKKESFTGSFQGMRYKMTKAKSGKEENQTDVLRVIHWPEPYGFDATDEEKKRQKDFSFDEEGIQQGIDWLNQSYSEEYRNR